MSLFYVSATCMIFQTLSTQVYIATPTELFGCVNNWNLCPEAFMANNFIQRLASNFGCFAGGSSRIAKSDGWILSLILPDYFSEVQHDVLILSSTNGWIDDLTHLKLVEISYADKSKTKDWNSNCL